MTKVLVIDEDKNFIEELRAGLTANGCAVQFANDGDHAVLVATYVPPDVVLVSLELSAGGGGLAVCKKVRHADGLGHVPIVVTSARAYEPNDELSAIISDYLCRPISIPDLIRRLNAVVAEAAARTEYQSEIEIISDDDISTTTNSALVDGGSAPQRRVSEAPKFPAFPAALRKPLDEPPLPAPNVADRTGRSRSVSGPPPRPSPAPAAASRPRYSAPPGVAQPVAPWPPGGTMPEPPAAEFAAPRPVAFQPTPLRPPVPGPNPTSTSTPSARPSVSPRVQNGAAPPGASRAVRRPNRDRPGDSFDKATEATRSKAETQALIESLQADKELATKREADLRIRASKGESLLDKLQSQVASLRKELAAADERTKTALEQARKEHREQIERQREILTAEGISNRPERSTEFDALREDYRRELAYETSTLRTTATALEERVKILEETYSRQLRSQEETHRKELENLAIVHEDDLERVRIEQAELREELVAKHAKVIGTHDGALGAVEEKHRQHLLDLQARHEVELERNRKTFEDSGVRHGELLADLEKARSDLLIAQSELSAARSELTEGRAQLDVAHREELRKRDETHCQALRELEERHRQQLSLSEEQHAEALAQQERSRAEAVEKAQADHHAALAAAAQDANDRVEEIRAKYLDFKTSLEANVEVVEASAVKQVDAIRYEMQQVQSLHRAELKRSSEARQLELEEMRQAHRRELEAEREKLVALRQSQAEALVEVEKKHAKAREEALFSFGQELDQARKQAFDLREQHADALREREDALRDTLRLREAEFRAEIIRADEAKAKAVRKAEDAGRAALRAAEEERTQALRELEESLADVVEKIADRHEAKVESLQAKLEAAGEELLNAVRVGRHELETALDDADRKRDEMLETTRASHQKVISRLEHAHREELTAARGLYDERIAKLNEEYAEVMEIRAAESKRRSEKADAAHAEALQKADQAYAQKVAALEARMDEIVERRIEQIREEDARKNATIMATFVAEHKTEVDALRERQSGHLVSLALKHESEARMKDQQFTKERLEYERSVREAAAKSERDLREAHEQNLTKIESDHYHLLTELASSHESKVTELISEHQRVMDTSALNHASIVETLKTDSQKHLSAQQMISEAKQLEIEARLDAMALDLECTKRDLDHAFEETRAQAAEIARRKEEYDTLMEEHVRSREILAAAVTQMGRLAKLST